MKGPWEADGDQGPVLLRDVSRLWRVQEEMPAGLEQSFRVGLLSSALRLKFESKGEEPMGRGWGSLPQPPQWSRFLEKVHPVLLK